MHWALEFAECPWDGGHGAVAPIVGPHPSQARHLSVDYLCILDCVSLVLTLVYYAFYCAGGGCCRFLQLEFSQV